eukprot:IDg16362t1
MLQVAKLLSAEQREYRDECAARDSIGAVRLSQAVQLSLPEERNVRVQRAFIYRSLAASNAAVMMGAGKQELESGIICSNVHRTS